MTGEDEYIELSSEPDSDIPVLSLSLHSCKGRQLMEEGFNSLRKEDAFSALEATPVDTVENIYEHLQ